MFDILWAIKAFICGKWLHQSAYCPRGKSFNLPAPVSARRIKMLAWFWGFRLMTFQEAKDMRDRCWRSDSDVGFSTFFRWAGMAWELGGEKSNTFLVIPH